MTTHGSKFVNGTISSNGFDDEFSIPLDISDILFICKEYNKLGWQIQNQVESILEIGIEESIKSGHVKRISLPHIKHFLQAICKNAYFGDAIAQATDCIELINLYEEQHAMPRNSELN